jgi:hypothetical protein
VEVNVDILQVQDIRLFWKFRGRDEF